MITAYHTRFLQTTHKRSDPQPDWNAPEGEIHIPRFYPVCQDPGSGRAVDYYMPGCPPESHQIAAVIDLVIQVLQGKAELPPAGSVIGAGNSTVCDECSRTRDVKADQKIRAHPER